MPRAEQTRMIEIRRRIKQRVAARLAIAETAAPPGNRHSPNAD